MVGCIQFGPLSLYRTLHLMLPVTRLRIDVPELWRALSWVRQQGNRTVLKILPPL